MPKVITKKQTARRALLKPKKKTKAELFKEQWSGDEISRSSSMVLRSTLADARAHYKDEAICTAGEAGAMVLGVPLPSFALEYALQNTVWPLERVVQMVGLEGTSKSGFTYEVARWFRRFSRGVATVFEHESKYSPDWAMSHIGWDDPDAIGVIPCSAVEDWQRKLGFMIDKCKRAMTGTKAEPGSGRIWPWLGIVDSTVGKAAEETQRNIDSKGSASRAWSVEAMLVTQYLKALPEKLTGWPFGVIAVNHLKTEKDAHTQATIRNKPGGKAMNFHETFELELSKMGRKIRTTKMDGTGLRLSVKKNSLGITDRYIKIDVTWWEEEVFDAQIGDMAWRQVTEWDWASAAIRLLMDLPVQEESKASRLKEILTIAPVTGGKVTCKALGITKSSPLSLKEAGLVLSESPEVLDALRKLYGVKIRENFSNDVDYRKQRVIEKRRIKVRQASKVKLVVPAQPKPEPTKKKQPTRNLLRRGHLLDDDDIEVLDDDDIEIEEDTDIEVE